jgi:hypothetical protein
MNMDVKIVWDMMPTSGRNLTVKWRQQAPLKLWYVHSYQTTLHNISEDCNLERNTCSCNDYHMKIGKELLLEETVHVHTQ